MIPWTAINLTDYYLVRHGRYDVGDMFRTDGRYGRVNPRGVGIYVLTVLVEIPFVNSSLYEGPIARGLGGADISWIVGFVLAAGLYYLAARRQPTAREPVSEPTPAA
jgi:NCS1 family nucleobase:cation symporter-1